ncbi:CDP-2,3-bis-(O-geranylgeranyl)-sn-glycerol synthase [Candidatus Micrarchaeota archaeon]|nr:CDP-2,3-bis-(O-geranylgeranyl)-sn-glycerol synthase [Candidatus Micrarchaeota archaeon]
MNDLDLLALLLFILPAYVANASPVLFGGGAPVDLKGKFCDRKRVFGDGKTWRGLIAGIACGSLVGVAETFFFSNNVFMLQGFLLSTGALAGDLLGSFIKRRSGIKRGQPSFLLDQLMFLFIALLFAAPVLASENAPFKLTPTGLLVLVVLTYFLHVSTNYFANKAGLKKVPW